MLEGTGVNAIRGVDVRHARMRQVFSVSIFPLVALFGLTWTLPAEAGIVPVVVTGDASPVAGATYSAFDIPVISDDGRIIFSATIAGGSVTSGTNQGLFVTAGSGASLLARKGSVSPMGGTYGGAFNDPMLRGGTLLFRNIPSGTLTAGLFGGTNLSAPALLGQSTNTSIKGRVDAQGDVAFGTVVSGGSRQYFVAAKTGSVLSSPTALAASDTNANRPGEIWMNDHGSVAFAEYFSASSQGMFLSAVTTPGARTTAATVTQSAPWVTAGAVYNAIGGGGFNNHGDAAYVASFSYSGGGGADGLFLRAANGTTTLLAKQGDTSPAGGTFSSFFHPNIGPTVLTDAGNVVFAARTGAWDAAQSDTAIYSLGVNGGRTIARQNDPVPGLGGTFVYSDLYTAGQELGVDAAGRVLFTANLDDTTTVGLDGTGLMLYDPATDKVSILLRTGGLFDIRGDGSIFSSIDAVAIALPSSSDPSNHDPVGAMYGNQLTFRLDFHNGMSGIYTAAVPEPGVLGTLALVASLGVRRRR